jgi:hypothetical protein
MAQVFVLPGHKLSPTSISPQAEGRPCAGYSAAGADELVVEATPARQTAISKMRPAGGEQVAMSGVQLAGTTRGISGQQTSVGSNEQVGVPAGCPTTDGGNCWPRQRRWVSRREARLVMAGRPNPVGGSGRYSPVAVLPTDAPHHARAQAMTQSFLMLLSDSGPSTSATSSPSRVLPNCDNHCASENLSIGTFEPRAALGKVGSRSRR